MLDLHQASAAQTLYDLAVRYTTAWCSQEPTQVATFFAQDGSLTINGDTPAVGRQAITAAAQGFMTAFPDLLVEMDQVVIEGDDVIYHWRLSGTNTGPGGTGRSVHLDGFEVWRFDALGLIASSQGHFDAADYQRQLLRGVSSRVQLHP